MNGRRISWAVLLAAFATLVGDNAFGQVVRVTGVTSFQYVDANSVVGDSVPVDLADGDGLFRRTRDGLLVRCVTGDPVCRYSRSGGTIYTVPMIQDVSVSAWGLGQGIRLYARLRGRAELSGTDGLWPRADDAFDALVAYAELDRGKLRVRGGRQWKVSGLGYYNFDGGSVLVRPTSRVSVEAYGGWSLARGLNEPRTGESLSSIESFAPDARALIFGGQASFRHPRWGALTALYQREIRDDRLGLFSERVAVDGVLRTARATIEASLETDLVRGTFNEARLQGRYTLKPGLEARAFARGYRPFFELWTIWGAFSPVGFDEVGIGGSWRRTGRPVTLDASFSYRTYDETSTTTAFGPTRSDGWRLGGTGTARLAPEWVLQARYTADIGFGAAKSHGTMRVQRDLGERSYVAVNGTAFQQIFEFRVTEGTVFGIGADGAVGISPRTRVAGSLSLYRHRVGADAPDVDWNQFRSSLRIEWTIGPEPGMAGRGTPR